MKKITENLRLYLLTNEDSNFGSMFLEFESMIEKCIAKFSRNHCWKKVTYKTQRVITKCLKQFDLRFFEEIGGKVHEKPKGWRKKTHFKSFRFAS